MARVETVVPTNDLTNDPTAGESWTSYVKLYPNQIKRDLAASKARPALESELGPSPESDRRSLERLADSLLEIGQVLPIAVRWDEDNGVYLVIDGERRRLAGEILHDRGYESFKLDCIILGDGDSLQRAVHANIKRRGYTAIQLAHLIQEIRSEYGWQGTKEVAKYLGVSRAQISQHDKLLRKPEGMDRETYDRLIAKVASGRMGADTAFWTLTHVEPTLAGPTLDRAEQIAEEEIAQEPASEPESGPTPTSDTGELQEGAVAGRESANKTKSGTAKTGSKTPVAKKKAGKVMGKTTAKPSGRLESQHVKQAAKDLDSAKIDAKVQRTLPELRKLFQSLIQPKYPDPMRSFISVVATQWWEGNAKESEVVEHWDQIAQLVRAQQKANGGGGGKSK